jgi:hypothetical protein
MATGKKTWEAAKSVFWGVLLFLGALWFWYGIVGNPLHELALIRRAQVAPCVLVETHENEHEDRGHLYFTDIGVYAFHVLDKGEFKTTTEVPTGCLKKQEEVEYLPDAPSVNRVRGDGRQSIIEWLWKYVGGMLFLALLLSPGIVLIHRGIRDIMKSRTTNAVAPTTKETSNSQ